MTHTKIVDRLRKLLELSKSDNAHEAAAAAAAAAELMLEHKIAEAELADDPDDVVEKVVDRTVGRDGRVVEWRRVLVRGLASAFGGDHYYYSGSQYGPKARYQVIVPESAVSTIEYMFSYLDKEVKRLADLAWVAKLDEWGGIDLVTARSWKSAFRLGCAREIAQRLSRQYRETRTKTQTAGKSNALMVLDKQKQAVDVYKKRLKLSTGAGSSAGGGGGMGAYNAGRQAGKGVGLGGGRGRLGAGARQLKGGK